MATYGLPILYTLLLWWLSTGAILYFDGLHPRTFIWSMSVATVVCALSVWGLAVTSGDATAAGAYEAFGFGLLAWGWQLVSFYMGYVTGPRKTGCDAQLRGWRRFTEAVLTVLYHELTVVMAAVVLAALTWNRPNQIGVWTYCVLWWMHQSAKLNIFFGVPNLGAELLPRHLNYLHSFMNRRPMNLLFPVSVSLSTIITVVLVQKAAAATSSFEVTGLTMLATLMALAIAEHWFMVLPLQTNYLWQWGVKTPPEVGEKARDFRAVTDALGWAEPLAVPDAETLFVQPAQIASDDHSDYPHPCHADAVLDSWSTHVPALCDPRSLRNVLESVGRGTFGDVTCIKGVVQTRASWISFEVAGAHAIMSAIVPRNRTEPLVVAIGRQFNSDGLKAAFDACAASA